MTTGTVHSAHEGSDVVPLPFKVTGIEVFWKHLHSQVLIPDQYQWRLAGMQGMVQTNQRSLPYREILREVLLAYDGEPTTPSIAGPKKTTIAKNRVYSPITAMLSTPLWEHAIEAGYQFLKIVENDKSVALTRIWAYLIPIIGHDLGKLRRLRPSKYSRELHPALGAAELERIINNRLPKNINEKLVNAVLNHHQLLRALERPRQHVTIAVVLCDRIARGMETKFDFNKFIAPLHRNHGTCFENPE